MYNIIKILCNETNQLEDLELNLDYNDLLNTIKYYNIKYEKIRLLNNQILININSVADLNIIKQLNNYSKQREIKHFNKYLFVEEYEAKKVFRFNENVFLYLGEVKKENSRTRTYIKYYYNKLIDRFFKVECKEEVNSYYEDSFMSVDIGRTNKNTIYKKLGELNVLESINKFKAIC